MSVSVLTTAIAVAASAVPNSEAPASAAVIAQDLLASDVAQPELTSSDPDQPLDLAQAQQPPASPATNSAQPVGTEQPVDPATTAQTAPQTAPPAPGQSEIVVTGRRPNPGDPLEDINAKSFNVAQSVDESLVGPIANVYGEIAPRPIRKGLRNFLHNLGEPIVFLNYLLQLKPGKAAETLGRFAINTTLGVGGVIDVAKRKPFNLPWRDNGFANTLGYYGVKPGPYFYLPLVGPTTLRDFIGDRVDLFLLPAVFPKFLRRTEVVVPVWVLSELGRRLEFDDELTAIRATRDPYVAARTYYLQRRQAEIDALHGRKTPMPIPGATKPTTPPASTTPVPGQSPEEPGGGSADRPAFDTSELLGLRDYSRLVGDLKDKPLVMLSGSSTQLLATADPIFSW